MKRRRRLDITSVYDTVLEDDGADIKDVSASNREVMTTLRGVGEECDKT